MCEGKHASLEACASQEIHMTVTPAPHGKQGLLFFHELIMKSITLQLSNF